jgi:hypothetical protein
MDPYSFAQTLSNTFKTAATETVIGALVMAAASFIGTIAGNRYSAWKFKKDQNKTKEDYPHANATATRYSPTGTRVGDTESEYYTQNIGARRLDINIVNIFPAHSDKEKLVVDALIQYLERARRLCVSESDSPVFHLKEVIPEDSFDQIAEFMGKKWRNYFSSGTNSMMEFCQRARPPRHIPVVTYALPALIAVLGHENPLKYRIIMITHDQLKGELPDPAHVLYPARGNVTPTFKNKQGIGYIDDPMHDEATRLQIIREFVERLNEDKNAWVKGQFLVEIETDESEYVPPLAPLERHPALPSPIYMSRRPFSPQ